MIDAELLQLLKGFDSLEQVASVLDSTDNSFGLEPRIGVISATDSGKGFAAPVQAWDVHIYFNGNDRASVQEALSLRYATCLAFPDLTVNRALTLSISRSVVKGWR
eukprot:COSAG02_NODE_7715_length_2877_cov_4.229662_2_plen_106_part_00